MATAVETVKNFIGVLKNYSQDSTQVGRIALDEAIRQTTIFSSLEEATNELKAMLADTETYPDTDTRLQKATGMVIGGIRDYSVDTGAISGSNAGGSTVKNAQSIVPEDGDLSTAELPTPGTTTPITYTGDDGKSFTFYVKWPDSFTTAIDCLTGNDDEFDVRLKDSRYHVDLDTLDPNGAYEIDAGFNNNLTISSPTYGKMKESIQIILKGMNAYWLREAAKLDYDSLGIGLDGQTIEIAFAAGGRFDHISARTSSTRDDKLPDDHMYLTISLVKYGRLDPTDPNGKDNYGVTLAQYLDRTIAHEMVHAIMLSTGTFKNNMPQFFTEGIADVVQGDDDYNAGVYEDIIKFVNDSDTFSSTLSFAPGTSTASAYSAGDMFMRFIAKQSLDLTSIVGDSTQAQTFDYDTKSAVITNYTESDTINYKYSVENISTSAAHNDLVVEYMPEDATNIYDKGYLVVRDVRGKTMTFNTNNGAVYAYMAENATEIDGRNFDGGSKYEILFGSEYANDTIRAGNAGSYLWGGLQGDDNLFGGSGQDTFIYNYGDEKDAINDASSQDIVKLGNMSLEKISAAQINDNGVNFTFTDGGSLNISGQAGTFILENDDVLTFYSADYQNKTWAQN